MNDANVTSYLLYVKVLKPVGYQSFRDGKICFSAFYAKFNY
jgi:hypothetical protein